jgi:hypothetical protein
MDFLSLFINYQVDKYPPLKASYQVHSDTPLSIPYCLMWNLRAHNTQTPTVAPSMRADLRTASLYNAVLGLSGQLLRR